MNELVDSYARARTSEPPATALQKALAEILPEKERSDVLSFLDGSQDEIYGPGSGAKFERILIDDCERYEAWQPESLAAEWKADPLGKHGWRYWNGTSWTEQVGDDGQQSIDARGLWMVFKGLPVRSMRERAAPLPNPDPNEVIGDIGKHTVNVRRFLDKLAARVRTDPPPVEVSEHNDYTNALLAWAESLGPDNFNMWRRAVFNAELVHGVVCVSEATGTHTGVVELVIESALRESVYGTIGRRAATVCEQFAPDIPLIIDMICHTLIEEGHRQQTDGGSKGPPAPTS
jgi:Protein of unknown function (DUF2510)